MPQVLFTLTQVVLLLITSTFTQVQIQSNLGTTGCTTEYIYMPGFRYILHLTLSIYLKGKAQQKIPSCRKHVT